VVGCSGTGSWVVEMLARLGVGRIVLVDPDCMERKNLNRIVNSRKADVDCKRAKVDVLADAIGALGLGTVVETYRSDLAKPDVVKALANCDFLFGCMDSADGRDLLNRIATYYSLPYIDVGVRLDANGNGGIEQICCAIHYLLPGGSSLLSRGVITSEQVQAQAVYWTNPEQYAALEKEGYIKGIAIDRPAVVSINGFAATHAVNEMLARLHPFRRDSGEDFRYQVFSLSDGAWLKLPDGPLRVSDRRHQRLMLRFGNRPANFLLHLGPAFARQDRAGNPAHAEGVIVKRLQKKHRGIRSEAQSVEEVVSRGFNEPLVTEKQHRLGFDHAFVTHLGGGFATVAKHFHHIRPSAGDHFWVLRGEVGPGHDQIHQRLGDGVILGLDDPAGLGLVAGLQTLLLSRRAVLTVIDAPASEHCESVLHSCLSFYGHELKTVKQQWRCSAEWCGSSEKFLHSLRRY